MEVPSAAPTTSPTRAPTQQCPFGDTSRFALRYSSTGPGGQRWKYAFNASSRIEFFTVSASAGLTLAQFNERCFCRCLELAPACIAIHTSVSVVNGARTCRLLHTTGGVAVTTRVNPSSSYALLPTPPPTQNPTLAPTPSPTFARVFAKRQPRVLNANNVTGYVFDGPQVEDQLGQALAQGDVNGDGKTDLIFGAPGGTGPTAASKVFVVFGTPNQTALVNARNLAFASNSDTRGFVLQGPVSERCGEALAVGDFDGDGIDDIAVGCPGAGVAQAGSVLLIFGRTAASGQLFPRTVASIRAGTAAGARELNFPDSLGFAGEALAVANFNGDASDDLVVGVPGANSGAVGAGLVTVVFGNTVRSAMPSLVLCGPAVPCFTHNIPSAGLGNTLTTGDLNNDGVADLVVGAEASDFSGRFQSGLVFVVSGAAIGAALPASGDINAAVAAVGALVGGKAAFHGAGSAVAAGDVDGDGISDLVLSALHAPGLDVAQGEVYIVFGPIATAGTTIDLLTASAGIVTFLGAGGPGEEIGRALAVGDLDNDGMREVLVGVADEAVSAPDIASEILIINGRPKTQFAAAIPMVDSTLNGIQSISAGAPGELVGRAILVSDDIDSDGGKELVIGAPGSNATGTNSGRVYALI